MLPLLPPPATAEDEELPPRGDNGESFGLLVTGRERGERMRSVSEGLRGDTMFIGAELPERRRPDWCPPRGEPPMARTPSLARSARGSVSSESSLALMGVGTVSSLSVVRSSCTLPE